MMSAMTTVSNDDSWSLTLNQVSIAGGTIAGGIVTWTIGDYVAPAGGSWSGGFFSDKDFAGQEPEAVAGEFQAIYTDIGAIRGAFGARKK